MPDVTDDNSKNQQESGEKSELEASNETGEKNTDKAQFPQRTKLYGSALCGCSCDTAMTKSCYRASWTTVVFTTALGFGLPAYSFYHKPHERD